MAEEFKTQKEKISDNYLQHISAYNVSSQQSRINFIGFFITINIALYYACFYLKINPGYNKIWGFFDLFYLLLILILLINNSIYIIYCREHFYDRKLDRLYQDYMEENSLKDVQKIRKDLKEKDNSNWGLTWRTIKFIFSVFNSIPFAYLMLDNSFWQCKNWISLIILSALLYFFYYSELCFGLVRKFNSYLNDLNISL